MVLHLPITGFFLQHDAEGPHPRSRFSVYDRLQQHNNGPWTRTNPYMIPGSVFLLSTLFSKRLNRMRCCQNRILILSLLILDMANLWCHADILLLTTSYLFGRRSLIYVGLYYGICEMTAMLASGFYLH